MSPRNLNQSRGNMTCEINTDVAQVASGPYCSKHTTLPVTGSLVLRLTLLGTS
eukprot:CAMPEP_0184383950 /NCGR_PEP_ID=MMETSP0007-20130409/7528_1 /TAXON_ID=97485 /ORGANISM="Prymnesium parvum, Strain Texoma1" /LENGTH=52 /DNA_ID=CAMNT_0026730629 /DNA_START=482 /DNA_END=637 /DNA_ORIENTATION=+